MTRLVWRVLQSTLYQYLTHAAMPVDPCRQAAPHPMPQILPVAWSRLTARNNPCQSAVGEEHSSLHPRWTDPSPDPNEGKVQ